MPINISNRTSKYQQEEALLFWYNPADKG